MDFCIVINTCKGYYENVSRLIGEIDLSLFPKENIMIISGQEEKEEILYENGIKIIKVCYTGLHLTSAIYIKENIELYPEIKYWVLLPDTIKFGETFFERIMNYYELYLKGREIDSLSFINPDIKPTMDMGILHSNHIMNISEYLEKVKLDSPYEYSELLELKRKLIYNENVILGFQTYNYRDEIKFNYKREYVKSGIYITNKKEEFRETMNEDGTINEIYFVNLDLYKYQRNFNGPNVRLILEL